MLNVSWIEQVSLVKPKPQLSLIKSKIVSQIKSKTVTSETAANDRTSVGYLMRWWDVSWHISAVLVAIMTTAEMHWVVDVAANVEAAVAQSRAVSGQDSM